MKFIIIFLLSSIAFAQSPLLLFLDDTVVDTTAPSAPTSLVATGYSDTNRVGHIVLTWTDPTNADLDSIRVYQGGNWIKSVAKAVQTTTIISLTSAVYSFTLKAKDFSGNLSVASTAASDTVYEFEVARWIATHTVAEDDSILWKINTIVKLLKDSLTIHEGTTIDSLAQAYDVLLPLGFTKDSANSKRNLVKRSHDAVAVGDWTFTAYQGWKRNSGNTYINTNYNPYTDTTGNFGKLSGGVGIYVRTNVAENMCDFGVTNGSEGGTRIFSRYTDNNAYLRYQSTTSLTATASQSNYMWVIDRTNSTTAVIYRNGLNGSYTLSASVNFVNYPFYIGALNQNGTPTNYPATKEYSFFPIRKSLSVNGNKAENFIIEWYMDSNGKGIQ